MENYNEKNEQQLLDLIKQKEKSDKMLLKLEIVIGILSMIVLFIPIFIAAFVEMETWLRFVVMFSGFIPCIIGLGFALKIEQVAGYYECKLCHHKYVPTYKDVNLAMHMGRTRYMKCPECHAKSWQKKVLQKK